MPSAGEIDTKMRAAAGRYAEYAEQKARLVAKGEARRQMALAEYASLIQALEVSPDDWGTRSIIAASDPRPFSFR